VDAVDGLQHEHDHAQNQEPQGHGLAVATKGPKRRDGYADCQRAIREEESHSHLDLE
jgi:hypothetical protein